MVTRLWLNIFQVRISPPHLLPCHGVWCSYGSLLFSSCGTDTGTEEELIQDYDSPTFEDAVQGAEFEEGGNRNVAIGAEDGDGVVGLRGHEGGDAKARAEEKEGGGIASLLKRISKTAGQVGPRLWAFFRFISLLVVFGSDVACPGDSGIETGVHLDVTHPRSCTDGYDVESV